MSDKVNSFTERLGQEVKDIKDKYDIGNFGDTKKESKLQVKWNRIRAKLFGETGVSNKFTQGVIMGATVGGVAGTVFGLASYAQHRKIIYVPIIALSMAVSFGFFMGVGTVIRTDNSHTDLSNLRIIEGKVVVGPPEWQLKYKVNS